MASGMAAEPVTRLGHALRRPISEVCPLFACAHEMLGLLKQGQKMNSAAYQNCVGVAAAQLVKQSLPAARVSEYYTEKAAKMRLPN
jgi:hypothetical protein